MKYECIACGTKIEELFEKIEEFKQEGCKLFE